MLRKLKLTVILPRNFSLIKNKPLPLGHATLCQIDLTAIISVAFAKPIKEMVTVIKQSVNSTK